MSTTASIPAPGTWIIDPSRSRVGFVATHLVVSKVRGEFGAFSGSIEVADPIERSAVEVIIEAASITTGDDERDGHVRGGDFLDVETFPELTFRSLGVHHRDDASWTIPGELTIRDVTLPTALSVDYLGVYTDTSGDDKAAFRAVAEIDREEFGITWNAALEAGGVLISKQVMIEIEVQLTRP